MGEHGARSTPVAIEPDTWMGGAKAHYDGFVA
jgi:hypothetical protein